MDVMKEMTNGEKARFKSDLQKNCLAFQDWPEMRKDLKKFQDETNEKFGDLDKKIDKIDRTLHYDDQSTISMSSQIRNINEKIQPNNPSKNSSKYYKIKDTTMLWLIRLAIFYLVGKEGFESIAK